MKNPLEESRHSRGTGWLEDLVRESRFGIRKLALSPGFSCVALLTLGLCLGANLTIFAVLDAVVIRKLPFPDPEQLVVINNAFPRIGIHRGGASIADYLERRKSVEAFASVSMFQNQNRYLRNADSTSRPVATANVTREFFETLGVPLAMGRTFSEEEMTTRSYQVAAPVAVITDRFWRNHFEADPEVLGSTFKINRQGQEAWYEPDSLTVVGVLPPGFRFLSSEAEFYQPYPHGESVGHKTGYRNQGHMIARLVTGKSVADAESELAVLNRQLLEVDPDGKAMAADGFHTWVSSLHDDHVRSVKPVLSLLQCGVLCLLFIGSVNLAGLLLIRASGRMKEMAVRKALGASRGRIAGQIMLETLLLALGGGALGIVFSNIGIQTIGSFGADALPLGANISFNSRTSAVALFVSLAVAVCIAAPIVWLNLRDKASVYLRSESRGGTASPGVQRLRHAFIVTQVAMSFVLLCVAGLLIASLNKVLATPPGFELDRVATADISISWGDYRSYPDRIEFIERLLHECRAMPGVVNAAVCSILPFEGIGTGRIRTEDFDPSSGDRIRSHYLPWVSPEYWDVLRIPLLKGRFFRDSDREALNKPGAAVVDETFANYYWPEGDAIGRRFSLNADGPFRDGIFSAFTVVGVVGNVKHNDLAENDEIGTAYLPFAHAGSYRVLLRTEGSATAMLPTLRRVIAGLDPRVPIKNLTTIRDLMDESLVLRRSPALLAVVFAGIALLLTAIGIYGGLSYAVAQRRREIGVRMAIGALPKQIGRHFLLLGSRLLVLGILLGFFGVWSTGQAIESFLFKVPLLHVPAILGTAAVLVVVTLMSCLLPAVRASRVDPVEALRSE